MKEVLARKGLNIQEVKVSVQDRMSGAVYVGGCDMSLVSLQQDV